MNRAKRILSVAVLAALMGVSTPSLAGDQVADQKLLELIKQQAAQIQQLKQRVSALETRRHETSTRSDVVATNKVAAPNTDGRSAASLEALRTAQLSAHAETTGSVEWGKYGAAGPTFSSSDGFFTFRPRGRLMEDFTTTW
ncbi:MAG TPA: hypothetical protein VFJ15_13280, partial [Oleiagrimonas sp.]|nr:hypothetical protein [Oleiagrimonas sp.]